MRGSGKRSRSARTAGVVNTTSPIWRSRTSRIRNSRLDGRLVDEYHRDVVFYRVDAMARAALERRSVLHQGDRRFTVRAGENLEQLRVNRHGREYMTLP